MECTPIYRGWKRDIFSLLVPNIVPWFEPKESQLLVQSYQDELSKFDNSGLPELAFLGRHWGRSGVNQSKRSISWYGQVSDHHGMVKCQTIMVVYDLSSLFERWRIKCSEKIATQVAFEWKNDEEGEQYKTTCFSYFSYSNFSCYSNWYFFMSFF
jgi:hypothetical protein